MRSLRAAGSTSLLLALLLASGWTAAETAPEGPADAGVLPADEPDAGETAVTDRLDTPRPSDWLPSRGRQCRRHRGRRVCDGPRMVPRPHGDAGALASRLGLGTRRTASHLLLGPPRPEWVEAVEGQPPDRLRWPVPGGRLWRGFGQTRHRGRRRFHRGVDIGAAEGTPIRAVADGLVAYSDNGSRGYGNLVMVVHADASVAFYAHCKAAFVFAGERVAAGQVVGEVGRTGVTQGAHLHFELRVEGSAIDPLPRMDDVPPRPPRAAQQRRRQRPRSDAL